MAVRWIGQAARELGIPVWDAIDLLAKEDEYPMNGLLDEERFQLLKRASRKGVEASGAQPARSAAPPPPPHAAPPAFRGEATAVTTAMPVLKDKSEEKTIIYPAGS